MADNTVHRGRTPSEAINIGATTAAVLGLLAAGAGLSAVLPDPTSPWLQAAAFLAPGSLAFAAYWWIVQKL
jgi:hypothetical protein